MVSLLALLLALAVAALISLRPWETTSLTPNLSVAAGIGIALDDSVVVAPAHRGHQVVSAHVADARPATFVANPAESRKRRSGLQMGISGARQVQQVDSISSPPTRPQPAPPGSPPPSTQPASAPSEPGPEADPPPVSTSAPHLVANFEDGLNGWSTAAVGDSLPEIVTGFAHDGNQSGAFQLFGKEPGSLLILGGDGGPSETETVPIRDGDEYAFGFSFYILTMTYGEPGADNLIMRFGGEASELQSFALQLWEFPGEDWYSAGRGLWASGEATGGERFLAPVAEGAWHEVVVHFKASSQAAGFYEVYLDGQVIDSRGGVSLIAPGSSHARIEVGLLRDAEQVQGTSQILIDAAKLGRTLESVLP